ncbi:MAG: hypothetical protein VX438_07720, partial [Planctomycetota bacterium]|nr:hypothetical protein [Planctomycetota bacterium]
PKKEGNTTKIVITKPDNYDEMLKKMQKEVEDGSALPPGLLGPAAPNSGFELPVEEEGDLPSELTPKDEGAEAEKDK